MQGIPEVALRIAFFVVIPVRVIKYYIPPNRNDLSNTQKFWGIRITKKFLELFAKNIFLTHFLVPQILTLFCTFFHAKIQRRMRNRQVLFCTDLSAKYGLRMIAYHNKKTELEIWGRFWKIDHLDFRKHPNEQAPLLAVRQTRHHQ